MRNIQHHFTVCTTLKQIKHSSNPSSHSPSVRTTEIMNEPNPSNRITSQASYHHDLGYRQLRCIARHSINMVLGLQDTNAILAKLHSRPHNQNPCPPSVQGSILVHGTEISKIRRQKYCSNRLNIESNLKHRTKLQSQHFFHPRCNELRCFTKLKCHIRPHKYCPNRLKTELNLKP